MARSRNIKPGFFANDLLAEVPPLGRLLFAGLWTLADREGRLEDRPKKIRAQIFPYDECDVDALLGELARRQFIQRYEVGGLRLIQVTTWQKHQNPHIKEPASTLPAPGQHQAVLVLHPDGHEAGIATPPVEDGAVQSRHRVAPALAQDQNPDSLVPASGETKAEPIEPPAPTGKTAGSGRADSEPMIPDSTRPNPDFPREPKPDQGAAIPPAEQVNPGGDSETLKTSLSEDSAIPSLGAIAKKIGLQLSPPEVAGFIMAHFPMQQVDRNQRALPGDSGLTLDQVNCIARHGCTLQNARKAFEHFQQEPHPKNPGAWAFHCLREELSQDARIELREETRSSQRAFKERAGRSLDEDPPPIPTGEKQPVSAALP